ncbi:hypothetical protein PGT21_037128 [Puccinia graminis f. sp. tritici]|uniref:Uncharacterized protein n=1 Tax=Puccinia graminis f. sp. tritici TaxID=56615 RepID=A0A5B0QQQ7_PUCGR|nr:hypothetical protein PGT21_037128 [Puccinia graminis f. sp. tritici]
MALTPSRRHKALSSRPQHGATPWRRRDVWQNSASEASPTCRAATAPRVTPSGRRTRPANSPSSIQLFALGLVIHKHRRQALQLLLHLALSRFVVPPRNKPPSPLRTTDSLLLSWVAGLQNRRKTETPATAAQPSMLSLGKIEVMLGA